MHENHNSDQSNFVRQNLKQDSDIELLKKEQNNLSEQVNKILNSMDNFLERFQDLSLHITETISYHNEKLNNQEKNLNIVMELVNKLENKVNNDYEKNETKISNIRDRFFTDLINNNDKIRQELMTKIEDQQKNINNLKKYIYIGIGALSVLIPVLESVIRKFFF